MKRFCALLLAAVYFATHVAWAHAPEKNLWDERRRALAEAPPSVAALPQAPVLPTLITQTLPNAAPVAHFPTGDPAVGAAVAAVPPQFGAVRQVALPQGTPQRVIVLLQDIHGHREAQQNIGQILGALDNTGFIALEGAFGPVDVAALRAFPDREAVRLAADALLRDNRISGAAHAALTLARDLPPMAGVDDPVHYAANVRAYRAAAPQQAARRQALAAERGAIDAEKARVFPPALRDFDARAAAYHAGTAPLGEFLQALPSTTQGPGIRLFLQALALEKSLDFSQVEKDRALLIQRLAAMLDKPSLNHLALRAAAVRANSGGQAAFYAHIKTLCAARGVPLTAAMDAYVRYVLAADRIDAAQLFAEMRAAEAAAYDALCRTDAERALVARSRRLLLTAKLINFALTPEEWKEYGDSRFSSSPLVGEDRGEGWLRAKTEDKSTPHPTLSHKGRGEKNQSAGLEPFESFYNEAEARNDTITRNLLQKDAELSVLVCGGFHAPGLTERLTRAGAAVVTVTPRVTKLDGEGGAYLSVFTREKTPLEKLFAGERLSVSAHPYSLEADLQQKALTLAAHEALTPGDQDETEGARLLSFTHRIKAWMDSTTVRFRVTNPATGQSTTQETAVQDGELAPVQDASDLQDAATNHAAFWAPLLAVLLPELAPAGVPFAPGWEEAARAPFRMSSQKTPRNQRRMIERAARKAERKSAPRNEPPTPPSRFTSRRLLIGAGLFAAGAAVLYKLFPSKTRETPAALPQPSTPPAALPSADASSTARPAVTDEDLALWLKDYLVGVSRLWKDAEGPYNKWAPLLVSMSQKMSVAPDHAQLAQVNIFFDKTDGRISPDPTTGYPTFDFLYTRGAVLDLLQTVRDPAVPPAVRRKADLLLQSMLVKGLGTVEFAHVFPHFGSLVNLLRRELAPARDPSSSGANPENAVYLTEKVLASPRLREAVKTFAALHARVEMSGHAAARTFAQEEGLTPQDADAIAGHLPKEKEGSNRPKEKEAANRLKSLLQDLSLTPLDQTERDMAMRHFHRQRAGAQGGPEEQITIARLLIAIEAEERGVPATLDALFSPAAGLPYGPFMSHFDDPALYVPTPAALRARLNALPGDKPQHASFANQAVYTALFWLAPFLATARALASDPSNPWLGAAATLLLMFTLLSGVLTWSYSAGVMAATRHGATEYENAFFSLSPWVRAFVETEEAWHRGTTRRFPILRRPGLLGFVLRALDEAGAKTAAILLVLIGRPAEGPPLGQALILSGPSGVGKTGLKRRLHAEHPGRFRDVISWTTRAPRPGEVHGRDYFFVTRKEFERARARGKFLESAPVHGHLYGTPIAPFREAARRGQIALADMNVDGWQRVKKLHPEFLSIFLVPPSMAELRRRLETRGTETPEKIEERLAAAAREMRHARAYGRRMIADAPRDLLHAVLEAVDGETLLRQRLLDLQAHADNAGGPWSRDARTFAVAILAAPPGQRPALLDAYADKLEAALSAVAPPLRRPLAAALAALVDERDITIPLLSPDVLRHLPMNALKDALDSARPGQPLSLRVVSPATLAGYGKALEAGFRTLAPLGVTLLTQDAPGAPDVTVVQWQGSEREQAQGPPVFQSHPGKKILLLHRPNEILTRYGPHTVKKTLASYDAVVVFGPAWLPLVQPLMSRGKPIVVLPHGTLGLQDVPSPERLAPDAVVAVGAFTAWGELRDVDDLADLANALRRILGRRDAHRVLAFAGGSYDDRTQPQLAALLAQDRALLMGNAQILRARDAGAFHDENSFRRWLLQQADGKVILRGGMDGNRIVPEAFAPEDGDLFAWQETLADFKVDMCWDRPAEGGRAMKEDEASGTLHRLGPNIPVVFDSRQMRDARDAEGLRMVHVPLDRAGRPDFLGAAGDMASAIRSPDVRRRVISQNLASARRFPMAAVAYGYAHLARALNTLPIHRARDLATHLEDAAFVIAAFMGLHHSPLWFGVAGAALFAHHIFYNLRADWRTAQANAARENRTLRPGRWHAGYILSLAAGLTALAALWAAALWLDLQPDPLMRAVGLANTLGLTYAHRRYSRRALRRLGASSAAIAPLSSTPRTSEDQRMVNLIQRLWPTDLFEERSVALKDRDWPVRRGRDFIQVGDYLFVSPETFRAHQEAFAPLRDKVIATALDDFQGRARFRYTAGHNFLSLILLQANPEAIRGKTIVDAGAGDGLLGTLALRLGAAKVVGIEIDGNRLIRARATSALNGSDDMTFLHADIFQAPQLLAGQKIDTVLASLPFNGFVNGHRQNNGHLALFHGLRPEHYFLLGTEFDAQDPAVLQTLRDSITKDGAARVDALDWSALYPGDPADISSSELYIRPPAEQEAPQRSGIQAAVRREPHFLFKNATHLEDAGLLLGAMLGFQVHGLFFIAMPILMALHHLRINRAKDWALAQERAADESRHLNAAVWHIQYVSTLLSGLGLLGFLWAGITWLGASDLMDTIIAGLGLTWLHRTYSAWALKTLGAADPWAPLSAARRPGPPLKTLIQNVWPGKRFYEKKIHFQNRDWTLRGSSEFIQMGNFLFVSPDTYAKHAKAFEPFKEHVIATEMHVENGNAYFSYGGTHTLLSVILMQANADALAGKVVLDARARDGLLGTLALRLGAAKVIGIERDEGAFLDARKAAALNGSSANMRIVRGDLADAESLVKGAKIDVVVARLLNNGFFEQGWAGNHHLELYLNFRPGHYFMLGASTDDSHLLSVRRALAAAGAQRKEIVHWGHIDPNDDSPGSSLCELHVPGPPRRRATPQQDAGNLLALAAPNDPAAEAVKNLTQALGGETSLRLDELRENFALHLDDALRDEDHARALRGALEARGVNAGDATSLKKLLRRALAPAGKKVYFVSGKDVKDSAGKDKLRRLAGILRDYYGPDDYLFVTEEESVGTQLRALLPAGTVLTRKNAFNIATIQEDLARRGLRRPQFYASPGVTLDTTGASEELRKAAEALQRILDALNSMPLTPLQLGLIDRAARAIATAA